MRHPAEVRTAASASRKTWAVSAPAGATGAAGGPACVVGGTTTAPVATSQAEAQSGAVNQSGCHVVLVEVQLRSNGDRA